MNDRIKKKAEKRQLTEKELENVNGGGTFDIYKKIFNNTKVVEPYNAAIKEITQSFFSQNKTEEQ